MFTWGTNSDSAYLGETEPRPCAACGRTCRFDVIARYTSKGFATRAGAYSEGGYVASRRYARVCSECRAETEVDRDEARPWLRHECIPFMRRHGLLLAVTLGPALIVLILVLMA